MSNKVTDFKSISKAIIEHARYVELHNKIMELGQETTDMGEPQCLGIQGRRGVGKTTLITAYYLAHLRNILFVTAPRPSTIKMMSTEMLISIKDPDAETGDQGSKNRRLISYIRDNSEIFLVIIDEFQHLIEAGTKMILYDVSDWLKYLIKATGKPFLVVGLEDKISEIIKANPQLDDLFEVETLEPFAFDIKKPESIQQFGDFLGSMEELLGIELPWRSGEDVDLIFRMHYATDGTIRSIKRFMFRAAKLANQRKADRLEMEILKDVFQRQIEKGLRKKHNPFDPKWGDRFAPPRDV